MGLAVLPDQERPALLSSRPPPDLTLVGQTLDGRYRIEALLGHGGMGAVYRATHVHLEQRVAIKVLRPHLAGDPVAARRFTREARGTFKLETDHAVKVSDFGVTEAGLLYMVMEYLDGRTVHDELQVDGAMAPARAVRIAAQVCNALAAAHRLGFIHRDIKPDNVMLVRRGADPDFVKVLDFGLAKLIEGAGAGPGGGAAPGAPGAPSSIGAGAGPGGGAAPGAPGAPSSIGAGGAPFSVAALTQGDMVFGTPEYMAPEQAMGHPLDARADLYALGATLFEMIAGRPPFVEKAPMKLLAAHVKQPAPRLGEVRPDLALPDELEAVIARCLAKSPDARPGSALELATALRRIEPTLGASAVARVPAAIASSATIDLAAVPPPPETVVTRGVKRSTKAAVVAVGVAVAAAGAVVVAATSRSTSRSTPDAAAATAAAAAAAADAAAVAAADAGADADADADAAAAPVADAAAAAPGTGTGPKRRDDELERHLAAAEAARRSGNRLRQLAEADAALARDARHVRARFLMGEALLETGDVANGCRYLRLAKRIREARAILASGRCPAD